MKNNPILRITRASEESTYAQEFADYAMIAEIRFPHYVYYIREISIFVYDDHRRLMGKSTIRTKKNQKKLKICRLEISSAECWKEGTYMVHVMCNGQYRWLAEITFGDDCSEEWFYGKAIMGSFYDHGAERFFAEELRHKEWFSRLFNERISARLVGELIEKLYLQRCLAEDGGCKQIRHMVVSGGKYDAAHFALFILSAYVTDGNAKSRFRFSLDDIASGIITLDDLLIEMQTHRAIAVEVTKTEFSHMLESTLNELADMIKNGDFNGTTFIFYGEKADVDEMRNRCEVLNGLFSDENTFCTGDSYNLDKNTANVCQDEESKMFDEAVAYYQGEKQEDKSGRKSEPTSAEICDNGLSAEEELQKMVGLEKLKNGIHEARMMALFQKERRTMNLDCSKENRHHMIFMGCPGTGKTTVAKLIGRMYFSMGLLSKGHTVETNRTKLVGKYIGHTEDKMRETIEEARGGVLFIDEAYTLLDGMDESNDFGKEVINALLTVLAEPDPDMIVILAGYEDKMQKLLKSNQGLKDRFPLCFHFENYKKEELMEICMNILRERNFILTKEAERRIEMIIDETVNKKDEYFGNGRWVHNFIEHGVIRSMAKRVMSTPHRPDDRQLLCTIEETDIIDTELNYVQNNTVSLEPQRHIGFTA